jgi:hypothetical protein
MSAKGERERHAIMGKPHVSLALQSFSIVNYTDKYGINIK